MSITTRTIPCANLHVLVVCPVLKIRNKNEKQYRLPREQLIETIKLVQSLSLEVAISEIVFIVHIQPATYLRKGTIERYKEAISSREISLAILDCALSPIQQRNLERIWKIKVIDRTALILEIFGARARTREGALQVELAHLSYQRSRLVRTWTHLERQRGGFGFLGGPGEAQIETDRRLISDRIAQLHLELGTIKRTRKLHRKARPYLVAAIIGYTNSGKSTLFNRLTRANVLAADQLFATLDPTMRVVRLPSGRNIILLDTVGFISNLPHELIAAFRATLEEIILADLIIHVRDVSHPETEIQRSNVETVLQELGFNEVAKDRLIEVYNKIDLLTVETRKKLISTSSESLHPLSAITGEGSQELLDLLDQRLAKNLLTTNIMVPLVDGETISWLYQNSEVLEHYADDSYFHFKVRLSLVDLTRLTKVRNYLVINQNLKTDSVPIKY